MLEKQHIKALEGYVAGFQPDISKNVIKLNSNENPYPPSPKIREGLANFNYERLRFYPNSRSDMLRKTLSKIYNLNPENIFCGNGSDEIISLLFKGFFEKDSSVVLPYPTYTLYETTSKIYEVNTIFVQTEEDFTIDVNKLLNHSSEAKGIVIVNPNAPTGLLLSIEKIKIILEQFNGLVIIDEAYIDFSDEKSSALNLVNTYPNLIVLRTLSKSYSLCGIRLGYCFASEHIISVLDKIKDSYNIDILTQLIAQEGLLDRDYFNANLKKVINTRSKLEKALVNLGFKVYDSQANFILCKPQNGYDAKTIYQYLFNKNVFIRYFNQVRLTDKLRITIGTEEETKILVNYLTQLINEREIKCEPNI